MRPSSSFGGCPLTARELSAPPHTLHTLRTSSPATVIQRFPSSLTHPVMILLKCACGTLDTRVNVHVSSGERNRYACVCIEFRRREEEEAAETDEDREGFGFPCVLRSSLQCGEK